MEPFAEKMKRDPALKSLFAQSWMLFLGLFWLIRFWPLRDEAIWLIRLSTYRGDQTESLVRVTLGRDGILHLGCALILLVPFFVMVTAYFIKRTGHSSHPPEPSPQSAG